MVISCQSEIEIDIKILFKRRAFGMFLAPVPPKKVFLYCPIANRGIRSVEKDFIRI